MIQDGLGPNGFQSLGNSTLHDFYLGSVYASFVRPALYQRDLFLRQPVQLIHWHHAPYFWSGLSRATRGACAASMVSNCIRPIFSGATRFER